MAEVSNSADYNVFAVEKQHTKQPEFINDTYVMETNDSNVTYDSPDMSHNVSKVDQHAVEPEDERVMLASLIANFKLNIDENKKIPKREHVKNEWENPITHDVKLLVKDILMPLTLDTKSIALLFETLLKTEMYADLKYVQSLKKEVDELQTNKNKFSKEYDLLLQECVSKDIMCSILHSFESLDEKTEMQCLYLEKHKECDNLEIELSKCKTQFAELKKHCISLELSLQHKNEVFQNNRPCNKQNAPEFPTFFEINEVKAQIQDKNTIISDLKAQLKDKTIVNAGMRSNDMVHNYYLEVAKKKAQLHKYKALNLKPSVITPASLPNTTSGSKPKPKISNQQPRNLPSSMSSQVTNKAVHIAEKPKNQKPFLKSKDLTCPTCKKCIYSANHNLCILKCLSKVNSRASAQKKDAQSHKTTNIYIPIEKKSNSKNHGRQISIEQRFSPNKTSAFYVKTTPPRSGLTWKPTGIIFTYVGLRWIPTKKSVENCNNTNDSVLPLGNETCTPNTIICANFPSLSAITSMLTNLFLPRVQRM
ncbi:hypothetical protein Tco_0756029 [Tanacetum coccineum]